MFKPMSRCVGNNTSNNSSNRTNNDNNNDDDGNSRSNNNDSNNKIANFYEGRIVDCQAHRRSGGGGSIVLAVCVKSSDDIWQCHSVEKSCVVCHSRLHTDVTVCHKLAVSGWIYIFFSTTSQPWPIVRHYSSFCCWSSIAHCMCSMEMLGGYCDTVEIGSA